MPAITTVSHPQDIKCMHIYFCGTICKKAISKAPFSVKLNVQLPFFSSNVLHKNGKAFNQNKTAIIYKIAIAIGHTSNSKPRFCFSFKKSFFFAFSEWILHFKNSNISQCNKALWSMQRGHTWCLSDNHKEQKINQTNKKNLLDNKTRAYVLY